MSPPIGTNDAGNDPLSEFVGRGLAAQQAVDGILDAREDTARRLAKILIGHLGVSHNDITPDVMLTAGANGKRSDRPNLGADSLDVVELAMAAEDEFNLELPDDEIEKLNQATFGDLVDFIHAKRRERGQVE
jgi:acyl carrier protein